VPLDPQYPEARLEYMLAHSGCRVVLSQEHGLPDVSWPPATTVLLLEGEQDEICGAYPEGNVEVADSGVCPPNLAHVLYRSDSAGEPAGSAASHRNIARLTHHLIDYGSAPTKLSAASPAFDALTLELWGALLQGKRCVMGASGPARFSATENTQGGRPNGATPAYVLGPWGELVPVGVVGELYLGGAGLTRGYLNQPSLTARKFIPHPFSETPGERLYRTGELARYLPDRQLEFMGPVEQEVKVRGLRIELGEIERVLLGQAGVRAAVVVGREAGAEGKGLVAYVVGETGTDAGSLRGVLQRQLRELGYRMPAALMVLESLPLTANGEVDREALPVPQESDQAQYSPPEGLTEELLAQLWRGLLKCERVGRQDHFFELGGHSLLATQLASRIRETFSTELPVREVFENATLSLQARAIERARDAGAPVDVPMEAVSRDEPLPLSYAQQRMLFLQEYMK
jgi:AMP-binding enzyme/Phosphopantetheine attachment site/AMP-binding enzyme C-terminal domain